MNPYYLTLDEPAIYMGVRIPDDSDLNTVTFSLVKRITLTVSSNGVASLLLGQCYSAGAPVGTLIPNPAVQTVGGGGSYVVGYKNNSAATAGALFNTAAGAGGSTPITLDSWNGTAQGVPSLCVSARLVSAGCTFRSTASTISNEGLFTGAFLPKGYVYGQGSSYYMAGLTSDLVAAIPDSIQVPVNSPDGMTLKYQPLDETCRTFVDLDIDPTSTDIATQDLFNPGAFLFCATGASANTTIQVCLVMNFEGVPRYNTLVFQNALDSAPDDPIAVAEAMNKISEQETAVAGTEGFDGLHSETHQIKGMVHPMVKTMGLSSTDHEASGIAIHRSAIKCMPSRSMDHAMTKDFDQGMSMFEQLANMVTSMAPAVPLMI